MSDDEASSEEDEDEDRDDSRREDDLEEDDESDEETTAAAATTTARPRKPLLRIPLSRTQPAAPVSQLLNQVNTNDEKKTRQLCVIVKS